MLDPTYIQILPIANATFESKVDPIPYITITKPIYWKDDMDITLRNILSKAKRIMFGKTRLGKQTTITAFYSVEHHTRYQLDPTNEHIHSLVTIDTPEYSEIFSMILWELLGMDRKRDRVDVFPYDNWPTIKNSWIEQKPVTLPIGKRDVHLPLKRQSYWKLDNDFQLADPRDFREIICYGGKSEDLERKYHMEQVSFSGYCEI